VIRIIPPGSSIFFLSVFIAICKFTLNNRNRFFWAALIFLGILIPVMQVTRITILAITSIYILHFFRGSLFRKAFTLVCITLATVLVVNSEIKPIRGMITEQEENIDAGHKYIRVLSADYYLTELSPELINYGFGNGVPYWGVSKYGKTIADMNEYYGFYLEDLGIISIYVMFGIIAVIGYLLIWIWSILIKVPEEYRYVKYFLWFLLANALTTGVLYNSDYVIVTVLVLHIFQSVYAFEKRIYNLKKFIKSLSRSDHPFIPEFIR
jgi:hypothetical protein